MGELTTEEVAAAFGVSLAVVADLDVPNDPLLWEMWCSYMGIEHPFKGRWEIVAAGALEAHRRWQVFDTLEAAMAAVSWRTRALFIHSEVCNPDLIEPLTARLHGLLPGLIIASVGMLKTGACHLELEMPADAYKWRDIMSE